MRGGGAQQRAPHAPGSALGANVLAPALALGVTALAYLRCFGNGFVYDDHEMILANRMLPDWSFLWRSFGHDLWWFRPGGSFPKSNYYRPLQDVWLGLNYQLFGFDPVGWHVAIVAMHLVVVYLVFRIARELTRSTWGAAAAALLFGLMPIHAQAAAWPSAIPLPMSAAFELGALLVFMRRRHAPLRRGTVAAALYAGAMFTHESAIVFPAIAGAYVLLLEQPASEGDGNAPASLLSRLTRTLSAIAPFIAVAILYLAVRFVVLGFISRPAPHNLASWTQVFFSLPEALANYAALLLMPWLAGLAHRFVFISSPVAPLFYVPALGLAALTIAGYLLLRDHPHRRLYLFLLAWGAFALAPVLNLRLIILDGLVADRYLYVSSAAFCIGLADLAVTFADARRQRRDLVIAIGVTLLCVYGVVLWHVEGYWHDEVALFGKCIKEFPDSTLCHGRLGMALEARGDLAGAEREFKRTLELDPDDGATLFNLGHLYQVTGRPHQAQQEIRLAIKQLPQLRSRLELALAAASMQAGDLAEAGQALDSAAADPAMADQTDVMRARLLVLRGDLPGAEKSLRAVIARAPGLAPAWESLATVLARAGRSDDALAAASRAVRLAPRSLSARLLLAELLHGAGRDGEALAEARAALAMEPANSRAQALVAQIAGSRVSSGAPARRVP
jgi:protein O-mannosyl-transferase